MYCLALKSSIKMFDNSETKPTTDETVNKFASEALLTFAGLYITRTVQQNKEGPHGNFVICI